jgi:TPR repeat protein
MIFRKKGFIIFGILLLVFTLKTAGLDSENNDNSGEASDAEDHVTLLNNEKEIEDDEPQESYSSQDFADEDIDKMPHVKESTIPPVSNIGHIFDEFVPEIEDKTLDSVTKTHLTNALNILGSSRSSDYTIYDIRAAYLDLESAAEAGSMEAQKVLAFAYLFGEYRWSVDEAKVFFEKLVAKGSTDGHLGMALLHLSGVTMKRPNRALGLLHLHFAANGGNPLAQMALGYRYQSGIDMKTNCEKALSWYKIVAKKLHQKLHFLVVHLFKDFAFLMKQIQHRVILWIQMSLHIIDIWLKTGTYPPY